MLPSMGQEYGFLVDLGTYTFTDDQPTWIQAFPLGTWTHPKYGEINVTPEKVARMAANVKAGVRGQELDIDYDHKMHSGEAAGWVKDAEARPNGLWLAVQWTKDAYAKVRDGAYKYFSPEYTDEWTNPVDNNVYKDVVFGGGITNRPFLKGILPINLSEAFASETTVQNTGGELDPKQIRALLKLSEDASDEDVTAKLQELVAPKKDDLAKTIRSLLKLDEKATEDEVTAKLTELTKPTGTDPTVQVLAENNPVIRQMLDEMTALKAANRLSEVNLALSELEKGDADFTLAPAILSEVRTVAMEAPKAVGDKVIALLGELRKGGIVDLREHGGRKPESHSSDDSATKRYTEAIDKLVNEKKLSYSVAANQVAASDPQLFDEYRSESYLRERG